MSTLPEETQQRLSTERLSQLEKLNVLTGEEAQELRSRATHNRPGNPAGRGIEPRPPVAAVLRTVQRAGAMTREAGVEPVTALLSVQGGALLGAAIAGPPGATVGAAVATSVLFEPVRQAHAFDNDWSWSDLWETLQSIYVWILAELELQNTL
ncbi:hypothetical protein [Kitasatospora sp. NBC_00458]|uniref:hypothetical protein n=1 Tax=Kitasatospora sp. NBC_00458 TaxID=2903568 RepID=UPI002E1941DA